MTGLDLSFYNGSDDALVLTPNLRLQRSFKKAYGFMKLADGIKVWKEPTVMSLQSWFESIWFELQDQGHEVASSLALVDQEKQLTLWSKIISEDEQGSVISISSLVSTAMSAQRTLELWQVANIDEHLQNTCETVNFTAWQQKFSSFLQTNNWVTLEAAVEIICDAILSGDIELPSQVVFYSFDETPPLYAYLIRCFRKSGVEVTHVDRESTPTSVKKIATGNKEDQFVLAARWAKAAIEDDPENRVAIVCPELANHRDEILSAFSDVFEPQNILPGTSRFTLPFNISAGKPLLQIPLIYDALEFLSIGGEIEKLSTISRLLRSPYIGSSEKELAARVCFDLQIKETRSLTISLDDVIQSSNCPEGLAKPLAEFLLTNSNAPTEQRPSQWAYHFNRCLEKLGWPGDRNLDSEEYQAFMQWHSLLEGLSRLDAIYSKCNKNQAATLLKSAAARHTFQPETKDSPVQILGILEAAGLEFDKTWVIDLNDDTWPQAPKPNAFIPLQMQTENNMPHSSAERELEFSNQIIRRIVSGAEDIVFSYAQNDGDRELRASDLIKEYKEITTQDLDLGDVSNYAELLFGSVPLISKEDKAPPVKEVENIKGGTSILTNQANCPFKAFAENRLKVTEMPETELGFSHLERGNLVHFTLEYIWKDLKNHKALVSLEADELLDLLNKAIDFAFFWLKEQRKNIGSRLLELERSRLIKVVTEWLELEKERVPFEVVECEKMIRCNIGGLPISVKRDRVDKVDGKRIALDYKSGKSYLSSWAGDRPTAPQLPIYAVTDKDGCDGAVFGQVRNNESAIKGIADINIVEKGVVTAGRVPDLPDSWSEIKKHWCEKLELLAKEFIAGVSEIKPKNSSVCRNCSCKLLCRI